MKNTEFSLNITTLDFLKKTVYNIIVEKSRKEEHGMDKTLEILAEKGYNINNIVAILKLKNGEKDKDQIDKDIVFMLPSFDELVLKKSLITNVQVTKNKEALTIDVRDFEKYRQDFSTSQFIVVNYNDIFENYFLSSNMIDEGLILLFKIALNIEFENNCSEEFFFNQLSHGETRAYKSIVAEIGNSGNISISAMIKKYNISRPVWTSLLKKMQEYKVADIVSQGVKGTYINIINPQLRVAALKK